MTTPILPTGHAELDVALRIGGIPRGCLVEYGGPVEANPFGLAVDLLQQAQRAGIVCALVDLRRRASLEQFQRAGIDLATLLVAQPESVEQALEICDTLARTGTVGLIVFDGIDLVEFPADRLPASHQGLFARLVSRSMRTICAVAHAVGTRVAFVRQAPRSAGTGPGAQALRLFASIRVELGLAGFERVACVTKHKFAAPFGVCHLDDTEPVESIAQSFREEPTP